MLSYRGYTGVKAGVEAVAGAGTIESEISTEAVVVAANVMVVVEDNGTGPVASSR